MCCVSVGSPKATMLPSMALGALQPSLLFTCCVGIKDQRNAK